MMARRVGWWRERGLLAGVLRCGGLGRKVGPEAKDACGPSGVRCVVLVWLRCGVGMGPGEVVIVLIWFCSCSSLFLLELTAARATVRAGCLHNGTVHT